jgi:Protein of unknown function (DUF2652)
MARSGFFLIADISGYTEFLAGSELDHAQAIMQALLGSLIGAIAAPLKLAKIEGDAIFCYAPSEAVTRPRTVLDGVDDLYARFSATLEHTLRNTTCPCRACRRAADLGLKFVLHHGEYIEQEIAGRSELTGTAVIVVHRLMKNRIREATGIEAYLYITSDAANAMGYAGRVRHDETVDGVGKVSGWVKDMAPGWRERREAERAWVAPDAPLWFGATHLDLPALPAEAWTYLLDTNRRLRWVEGMTGMTVDGAMGKGAMLHCAHGAEVRDFEIVDWRPFESVSLDRHLPHGAVVRLTYDFAETPTGTHLEARTAVIKDGGPLGRLRLALRRIKAQASTAHSLATLGRIVAEDAAAERV